MPAAMATAESDSRLIERVGHGDREAFEQLYKRFARPVFAGSTPQATGRAKPGMTPAVLTTDATRGLDDGNVSRARSAAGTTAASP